MTALRPLKKCETQEKRRNEEIMQFILKSASSNAVANEAKTPTQPTQDDAAVHPPASPLASAALDLAAGVLLGMSAIAKVPGRPPQGKAAIAVMSAVLTQSALGKLKNMNRRAEEDAGNFK